MVVVIILMELAIMSKVLTVLTLILEMVNLPLKPGLTPLKLAIIQVVLTDGRTQKLNVGI